MAERSWKRFPPENAPGIAAGDPLLTMTGLRNFSPSLLDIAAQML
jgi:hypothetical protein